MSNVEQTTPKRSWPDYRAVWRWHFYAGLFCIPFIIILSISGSIYLFKPEIESWIDRAEDSLTIQGSAASAADQIRAAIAAVPGSALNAYEVPNHERAAARVIVSKAGQATRVYIHPQTLEVLKMTPEDQRFMRVLFKLHGELLFGNRGSAVVELAASWAIIMIVTGLVLWWPRKANGLAGILYPRLSRGSKVFWRDIHAVTGFWISGLTLFLLLSGLPWAKFWGDYFRNVRRLTGTAVAVQDWTNGTPTPTPAPSGSGDSALHPSDHNMGSPRGGGRRRGGNTPSDLTPVDRIVATLRPLQLPPPVVIAPPEKGSTDWTAKSMTPNRPKRVDLVMDGPTGSIKDRKDFKDRHWIDRVVGTGVAAHEGQLFGLPNQLLGLVTAFGLVLLSVSSLVMWWRRRDPGELGAPRPGLPARFSLGLLIVVILFGIYLPLFGASLIGVKLLETVILKRIRRVADWLGLATAPSRSSVVQSAASAP